MRLVVIEGGDGTGKTSVVNKLCYKLLNSTSYRLPGATQFGEKIREILLSNNGLSKQTIYNLFLACDSEFFFNELPKCENYDYVFLDRCWCSRLVYQHYIGGLSYEKCLDDFVHNYNKQTFSHTIILTVRSEVALERMRKRGEEPNEYDKTIAMQTEFYTQVAKKFNCPIIDTSDLTEDEVLKRVVTLIKGPGNPKSFGN
jgi:dTMP kinase